MAIRDLIEQLNLISATSTLDPASQTALRDAILRLLDDGSSDVSTSAVKCLSAIVQKFSADQVAAVVQKLATMVADRKRSANRDVISDGLKTVVGAMSEDNGKVIIHFIHTHILPVMNQSINQSILTVSIYPGCRIESDSTTS